jgi:type VI secretion system protein ImpG
MPAPIVNRLDHYVQLAEARLQALMDEWAQKNPNDPVRETVARDVLYGLPLKLLLAALAREWGRSDQQRELSLVRLHRALVQRLDPLQEKSIPSCMVVQLSPGVGTTPGHKVARGAVLQPSPRNDALIGDAVSVRYRLAQEVQFWPIEVAEAGLSRVEDHYEIRLGLKAVGTTFSQLRGLDQLTIYLHEPTNREARLDRPFQLYEALVTAEAAVAGPPRHPLTVQPRGFGPEENLLPAEPRDLPSTRLLLEFAVLPERFLFVTFSGLGKAREGAGETLEIVVRLQGGRAFSPDVKAGNFQLQCAPAYNTSSFKTAHVDLRANRFLHPIEPNVNGSGPLEVVGVRKVTVQGTDEEVPAFGAARHDETQRGRRLFHICVRDLDSANSARPALWTLRLVDATGQPLTAQETPPMVTVKVECIHGDLAVQVPIHWLCGDHEVTPLVAPTLVLRPTDTPTLAEWAGLLSLGLTNEAAERFRQRLLAVLGLNLWSPATKFQTLHANRQAWLRNLILGLGPLSLEEDGEPMVWEPEAHPVWVPGRRCSWPIDAGRFPGESVFLFGQVLDRVLADRCAANRFTRLVLKTPGEACFWRPHMALSQDWLPRLERKERTA